MFKRTIKNELTSKAIINVPPNTVITHPITLTTINSNDFTNPICLTKMHISNNKLNTMGNYVCNNENNYQEYIQLPPYELNTSDLLQIYDINNIDGLIYWIKSNIKEYNVFTLKRVLNCWITNNISILKIHNNILNNICKLLLDDGNYIERIFVEHINFDDEIKDFINYWIEKYDIKNKDLDLIDDVKKFLYNKLEK